MSKIKDRADLYYDSVAAETRAKYLDRWRELSGGEEIDYSVPRVELEFMLCDARNLALISKGKKRDEFLAKLSEGAARLYLEDVDEDGNRYTDLENKKIMWEIGRAIVKRGRR